MAVNAAVVWEVQTGGNDNNGGGYKTGATGTDYSQQTSAQWALTGVTSSGSGNTILDASAAASMVGNTICVVSGTNFNTGFYEITSVSVGVSITCSTNQAGQSISSGVGASGVMNIGGCMASPGRITPSAATSNKVWIKSGTYTISNTTTGTANSTVTYTGVLRIEGYQTTRGDLGTKPVLSASGISSTNIITHSNWSVVVNLELNGNSLTSMRGFNGDAGGLYFCKITGCPNRGVSAAASLIIYGCEFSTCNIGAYGGYVVLSEAYSCTSAGFQAGYICYGCISHSNTTSGAVGFTNSRYIFCVAYNNNNDGFRLSDGTATVGCHAESNGRYGYYSGSSYVVFLINCGEYNNTTAAFNGSGTITGVEINTLSLSGSAFVDAANRDFRLNNTANAGALLRGIGYTFPYSTSTISYLDSGAAQHADPASLTPSLIQSAFIKTLGD